ncbi:ECF transporter S component [bacterium]|nr:ECF transporter S component [bacterium]
MHPVSRTVTFSGLFIALGVLLPLLFHSVGLGPVFLPMFWPVAAAGFFLAPGPALFVGMCTPFLSLLLTGMPPVPMVYKMVMELAVLGAVVSAVRTRLPYGRLPTLLIAICAAELTGIAGSALLAPLLGLPPALYAAGGLVRSLPGIAVMLILLPLLLARFGPAAAPDRGGRHVS